MKRFIAAAVVLIGATRGAPKASTAGAIDQDSPIVPDKVAVDEHTLRFNAVRLNITMPQRVLDAVDHYAAAHGDSRSGLLVRAVSAYMGRQEDKALRPARRGRPGKANPKGR